MKTITKSTNGKTKEEEELEKLKEIINRIKNYANNDLKEHLQSKKYNSNRKSKSLHITKSNFQKNSSSKTREDRNDREFLTNFMNDDDYISIGAQNMHLLSDDDKNQSITSREKFKKLSKLMLDDKEVVVENGFGMEEDKMILHLFTALSRKAKKVFVEEDIDKLNRLQVFFRRINGIKLPQVPENTDVNEEGESESDETDLKEKDVISFMKKELPKINCDLLSNINHNFITIEEIYNSDEMKRKNENDDDNNILYPVVAEEVGKEVSDQNIVNETNLPNWDNNKFLDFNAHCPNKKYIFRPDRNAIKYMNKIKHKQNKSIQKIIELGELDEEYFPKNSENMPLELIYEFALRNKIMEETRTDSITLVETLRINENKTLSLNNNTEMKEEEHFDLNNSLTEESKKENFDEINDNDTNLNNFTNNEIFNDSKQQKTISSNNDNEPKEESKETDKEKEKNDKKGEAQNSFKSLNLSSSM